MPVDEGDGGRLAVREFDGEAEGKARADEAELVAADLVEEAGTVAEDDGDGGDGIPDDVAEAAQAGKVGGDFVPVGVEGEGLRRAEGDEALGAGRDDAGVDGVELKACAGRERCGEGERRPRGVGRCGRYRN